MRAVGLRPTAVLLGATLAFVLAGCGASTAPGTGGTDGPVATTTATPAATPALSACQAQWSDLAEALAGRDAATDPSDLADRWAPVLATAEHYRASATDDDCVGPIAPLAQAQDTIARIEELSAQLRQFDVAHRAAPLLSDAAAYLRNPLPRPRGTGPHADRPPSKADVRRALAVLEQQTAASFADMKDGWDEANAVDLADDAAVRRTVADLRFLAGDSAPFRACAAALVVLTRAASFS
jgi:hypothetical protein